MNHDKLTELYILLKEGDNNFTVKDADYVHQSITDCKNGIGIENREEVKHEGFQEAWIKITEIISEMSLGIRGSTANSVVLNAINFQLEKSVNYNPYNIAISNISRLKATLLFYHKLLSQLNAQDGDIVAYGKTMHELMDDGGDKAYHAIYPHENK